MLLAIHTRPRVVNAVPWQTAFVALAETFPQLTDLILERNPALVGISASQPVLETSPPPALAVPVEPPAEAAPATSFDEALEPLARRMERVKLSPAFVRGLLVNGTLLDPSEVAMRWAGMPNKNERAVTVAVLGALAEAGYLGANGNGYRVLREPEAAAR
jgi:hypothetical protein